jgi:large subunit ribosomal protein L10
MSKKVKGFIQQEYAKHYEDVSECMVVSLRGLSGVENNELRGDLLAKDIHLNVVKNSLARRAFAELGQGGIGEILTGPCAIAFGGDSIVDVAKVMVEWSKKFEALEIKGGYLEEKVLDAQAAEALSKMPNRRELQATVVAQALAPGGNISGALLGPAGRIAGCLKSLIEKLEETEAA